MLCTYFHYHYIIIILYDYIIIKLIIVILAKFGLHGNFVERNFQLFISRILLVDTVASELILVLQEVGEMIKAMIL